MAIRDDLKDVKRGANTALGFSLGLLLLPLALLSLVLIGMCVLGWVLR